MNSIVGLILIFALPVSSFASNMCQRTSSLKTADEAANAKFLCGAGKNSFTAVCDLTVDPAEFGKGWIEVESAQWAQHNGNAGIEGKFGFIVCSVRTPR